MGHFPWPWYAMISRGYPFHIPMVCLKKPISVCQTGCISARILVKKTGLTLLLILITLLLLLIYVLYIYIYISDIPYIYMVALHVVFPLWTPFAIHWPMCWGLVWRSPVWILRFVGVEEHHLHHLHQLEPRDQGDDHFHNPEKIAWLMGEFLGNYI